jgi:hypothetical protein
MAPPYVIHRHSRTELCASSLGQFDSPAKIAKDVLTRIRVSLGTLSRSSSGIRTYLCDILSFPRQAGSQPRYVARQSLSVVASQPHDLTPRQEKRPLQKLFPIGVREYSTAGDFDTVTHLATNPVDSRLRSVLVRIRCEMPPGRRRSFPWRCGPSRRVDKIATVHFPMKIVGTKKPFETIQRRVPPTFVRSGLNDCQPCG